MSARDESRRPARPARPATARALICLVATLVPIGAMAARPDPLKPSERAVVAWIEAHAAEAEALLERTVNLNSGTLNLDGVRAVGALFRAELDALGFATRWEEGAAVGRAGHLVAERKGRTGAKGSKPGEPRLRVLLIGHLDTVFEKDSPFQRFERGGPGASGERTARGPGVIDMKGGDVIVVLLLRALAAERLLDRFDVTVVFTGDEEKPGRPLAVSRRTLVEAAHSADVALGFEDGDGDPGRAVVARRSSTPWELRVTGKAAHSSLLFRPETGAGALFEAARVLDGFRVRLQGEPYLTFNPGLAAGGATAVLDKGRASATATGKDNIVATEALVTGDLRALSPEQLERAKAAMCEVASEPLPLTDSTLTFAEGYPPMAPSDGNRMLLAMYDRASRDLGLGEVVAVDPGKAGAADVSFTAPHVGMAMDSLGLRGSGGHTVEETAALDWLPRQAQRAALLLLRLEAARATGAKPPAR